MGESLSGSDLFNDLAFEFAERYRRGERPSLNEYVDRYPHLAEEIRELFPTLAMMERIGSDADPPRGPGAERPRPDVPIPERLGDYRILREIGRGGMGVVYEAVQESLGRPVALKVLSPDRSSGPVAQIRFRREAQTAALLHHTNIVPVFGVGEHEGVSYYAMQYIRGRGLDAVLRELAAMRREAGRAGAGGTGRPDSLPAGLATGLVTGRYSDLTVAAGASGGLPPSTSEPDGPREDRAASPSTGAGAAGADRPSSDSSHLRRAESPYFREVARMARQAAEALAYAHAHGVIHRDVKPSNLLLDVQGTIWVTDFGLAKAEGSDELTRTGDVVGTLRYMAPERFRGQADARSDIYGLGMTLYEMLALEPAFRASHRVQLMHAIVHDEPRRPREHDPRIPRDLETIVLKAIAKDPADRFADAGAMAAELGRFLEGRPIRSRPLSLPERIWRWSRRNPALAASSLVASALAVLLVIGSVWAALFYRERRDAVTAAQRDTEASRDRALAAGRESQAELVRSLLQQARAERLSGRPGRRATALEALTHAAGIAREVGAPPEDLARLRDEVIAALALTDDQTVQVRQGFDVAPPLAACSIDADRYVVLRPNGSIHVHRLSDGSEVRVVGSDRPLDRYWIRFVPGGRFACVDAGALQIELWDLERGEVPSAWPADVRCAVPRPDGRQVAALRSNGELRVYDLPAATDSSRCRLGVAVPSRLAPASMSLAEDGRHLALIPPDRSRACVYEVGSGRVVCDLKTPSDPLVEAVALSRDGRLLAVNHDRTISVHEVGNGEQLALLQGHHAAGITFSFQPAGDLLASQSWDATTRLWDPLRGRLLMTQGGTLLDWAASGSLIAILRDQQLTLHRLAAGDVRRTIDCRMLGNRTIRAPSFPWGVAYSPDGQLIAIPVAAGVVVARAGDGSELAFLPIGPCDQALFLPQDMLLTYQGRGLCRWPVRRLEGGRLRLGPPEPLAVPDQGPDFAFTGLAASANGRLVGVTLPAQGGAVLLDPDRPWRRTWLTPHQGASSLAISPDGRWAATTGRSASPDGRLLKVWDAATGRLLLRLPVGIAKVAFSPDGQWLGVGAVRWPGVAGESRYRFFRTGSWTPRPEFDHGIENGIAPLAYHPCGRIAAIRDSYRSWTQGRSRLRLVDLETGGVLASLESPEDANTYEVKFSPDGRFLAAVQTDYRVDVWDLSRLRRRLEELDLATGLPDVFGGTESSGAAPTVERIDVEGIDPAGLRLLAVRQTLRRAWFAFRVLLDSDLADSRELFLRGDCWAGMGQWRLAAADYAHAFAGETPDDPLRRFQHVVLRAAAGDVAGYRSACDDMLAALGKTNGRIWLELGAHAWTIAPDGPAAIAQALQLAKRRAAAIPIRWSDHVLGLARYRAGLFAEADAGLQASLDRDPGWDYRVLDWLVIAMAQKQLGRPDESRRWLGRAETWVSARLRGRPGGLDRAVPENWHWRDGVLLHLLLREARALFSEVLPVGRSRP
jgi:serine/threonine protein kinase/WD40 repeat protein